MIQAAISFCSATSMIALVILLILAVFSAFTISPRFESIFSKTQAGPFDFGFPFFSKYFNRPTAYMVCIVRGKSLSSNARCGFFYGDYDFKAHAKKWEIIYSHIYFCICVLCVIFLFMSAILYFGAKLFNMPVTLT